jgi:hypothetical protein
MHFLEHIIEPSKLLLAWQPANEKHRTRYIVGEFQRLSDEVHLVYLTNSKDFANAKQHGFEAYPAFPDTSTIHHNVLDAFMRRLPPRTRGDFSDYLKGFRLRPNVQISDFALLGYSGAKLLSDGFSIIHPFSDVQGACELLLEAAGYRHIRHNKTYPKVNDAACFSKEWNNAIQETAIRIDVNNNCIGYVNRGLIPTFIEWIENNRIQGAWVEKINGTPGKPTVYLYVKIAARD